MQNELTLNLTLKCKWFDMILSGVKTEEYREIKPYWLRRFLDISQVPAECKDDYKNIAEDILYDYERHGDLFACMAAYYCGLKKFTHIKFTNGYGNHRPSFTIECKGIRIGRGNPEWGAPTDIDVFILELGNIINTQNIKS